MSTRREFVKLTATGAAALSVNTSFAKNILSPTTTNNPVVLSTWKHGQEANEEAWKILSSGGHALDAVEKGVMVTEADLTNLSVGLGGLPDRDGHVTLDASIMNEKGECGSVCFLEHIKHPISVARMVMEKTPHIMLAGEGALKFALDNGFEKIKQDRTEGADKAWKEWLTKSEYKPVINFENHDTIGMIAMDAAGNLSGSCTTSGLSYKMHGRVGDSPIIGAGMYVDNEVGAACATGLGEAVIRICGSFLIVELMRQGLAPEVACMKAIERLIMKNPNFKDLQVGFLALNKKGEYGSYSLQKGFNYAVYSNRVKNKLTDSKFVFDAAKK